MIIQAPMKYHSETSEEIQLLQPCAPVQLGFILSSSSNARRHGAIDGITDSGPAWRNYLGPSFVTDG